MSKNKRDKIIDFNISFLYLFFTLSIPYIIQILL